MKGNIYKKGTLLRIKEFGSEDDGAKKDEETQAKLKTMVLRVFNPAIVGIQEGNEFAKPEDNKRLKGKTGGMLEILAPPQAKQAYEIGYAMKLVDFPGVNVCDVTFEELTEEEGKEFKDMPSIFKDKVEEEVSDIILPPGAMMN